MSKYIQIKFLKILGASVYIHWSTLLASGGLIFFWFESPILAVISICSYFSVILLHEYGHAYFAKKLGYEVYSIYLEFMVGLCEFEEPYYEKHDCIIAWGGVIAQLVVAIPLLILAQLSNILEVYGVGSVVAILGYYSLLLAILNLLPIGILDGVKAWKLVPILLNERSIKQKKHKVKKRKFKVVK